MPREDFLEAKVVVLGSQGVGKTSLVSRFVQQTFSSSGTCTVGASFLTKKLTVDGCNVKLQIWDTAGQERFRSMAPMYYRGANAAVLVYDITSEQSFLDVSSWVQELKKNVAEDLIIHIVGSKLDLSLQHRAVHPGLAAEYARTSNNRPSSPCFSLSARNSVPSIAIGTPSNRPYLPETVTLRRASIQHYPSQQHHLPSSSLHQYSNSHSNSRIPVHTRSPHALSRSNPPSPAPESPTHRRAMSYGSSCTLQSFSSSESSSTTVAGSNPASPPQPQPNRAHKAPFPDSPTPHFQFPVLPKTIVPTMTSPDSKMGARMRINTKCVRYESSRPVTAPVIADGNSNSLAVTWSEVSSKDDEGVQALFMDLARRLVARKDEIEKTRKKGSMKIGSRSDVDEGTRNDRWDRTGRGAACCGI